MLKHTWFVVVVIGAVLLYFMWWMSGAASACSFWDTIMHKCGANTVVS